MHSQQGLKTPNRVYPRSLPRSRSHQIYRFAWITKAAVPGSYLAAIFSIIDDDYKLNVLSIRQGRPGWHSVITGTVSPLRECAPIGDRTCPIYGAGSVKWRTNTKLAVCSVEISWDTTEQSIHDLKLLFLCYRPGKYQSPTIESVSTQTNFIKNGRRCPGLPYWLQKCGLKETTITSFPWASS